MLVFLIRYMDLLMYFVSIYNTLMKIFFISSTAFIIYLMRYKKPFCTTYDSIGDDFPHWKVILPAAFVCTLFVNTSYYDVWEFMWSFSLWLEALAFVPQIVMLNKIRIIENITSHYVVAQGLYRFFYLLNWFYRYFVMEQFCWTQVLSGTLQTVLIVDFIYYYVQTCCTLQQF